MALVYAVHDKRPQKQFTRLEKRSKADPGRVAQGLGGAGQVG